MKRCQSETSAKGKKCRRLATDKYCWQHQTSASEIVDKILYLSVLPHDLLRLLFFQLKSSAILAIIPKLKNSMDFSYISDDEKLWKMLWTRDISSCTTLKRYSYNAYKKIYIELREIKSTQNKIRYLSENGYDELLLSRLLRYRTRFDLPHYYYITGGYNLERLKWAYEIHNNNIAMKHAARCGHIKIVKDMLDLGANHYSAAINFANMGNHRLISKLIQSYIEN